MSWLCNHTGSARLTTAIASLTAIGFLFYFAPKADGIEGIMIVAFAVALWVGTGSFIWQFVGD